MQGDHCDPRRDGSAVFCGGHECGGPDDPPRRPLRVEGEFGRTPVISKQVGRDHWPRVACALLAGGGIKGGFVHGASDRTGALPADQPTSPGDIIATGTPPGIGNARNAGLLAMRILGTSDAALRERLTALAAETNARAKSATLELPQP